MNGADTGNYTDISHCESVARNEFAAGQKCVQKIEGFFQFLNFIFIERSSASQKGIL